METVVRSDDGVTWDVHVTSFEPSSYGLTYEVTDIRPVGSTPAGAEPATADPEV